MLQQVLVCFFVITYFHIKILVGTESDGLLGSVNFNLKRECVLLIKKNSMVYKIIITLVIAFIFPFILFHSNLEHLINLGLHNMQSNSQSMCVNPGKVTVRTTLAPTYPTTLYHTSLPFSSTIIIPSTQSFFTPLIPSVKLLGGTRLKQIIFFIHYFLFLFNFVYYFLFYLVLYFNK